MQKIFIFLIGKNLKKKKKKKWKKKIELEFFRKRDSPPTVFRLHKLAFHVHTNYETNIIIS